MFEVGSKVGLQDDYRGVEGLKSTADGAAGALDGTVFFTIPGDDSTTEVITVGGFREETLDFTGDLDWFRLDLVAGQTVQIDLFGLDHDAGNGLGELEDPYLRLYNPAGTLVAQNDDIILGVDRDSRLVFTSTESGTFFVEVDSYLSDYVGDYRLEVSVTVPPPPAVPLDAIEGSFGLDTSDPVLVYFAQAGDSYFDDELGWLTADGVNAYEQGQLWSVFTHVETIVDIDFEVTTNRSAADLEWATAKLPSDAGGTLLGFFYFPGGPGFGFLNNDWPSWSSAPGGGLDLGGFMYGVAVHELGHGLGLAHPHDTGFGSEIMQGVSSSSDLGNFSLNQAAFTQMSYNEGWADNPAGLASSFATNGHAATYAALDIAALQNLYGANTTHASGNDTYMLDTAQVQGTGYYTIWDTGGIDEIVALTAADAIIDLRAATLAYELGGGGFMSYVDGIIGGHTIANGVVIENATTGGGNDQITGNTAANTIIAGAGNDQIFGDDGNDTLTGGTGADALDGGVGSDTASYAGASARVEAALWQGGGSVGDALGDTYSGIENLRGSQFDDLLVGDKNANGLIGGDGNDIIYGGGADDVLDGGAGADVITGGAGDDILTGGIGDDILQGDGGADTLTGGGGSDTASYASAASRVEAALWQGGGSVGDALGDTYSGIENLRGSQFDDLLVGDKNANGLIGGDGVDLLFGGSGNDTLAGDNGSDILGGGAGDDTLTGGNGDDTLQGDGGADTLTGGGGSDTASYASAASRVEAALWQGGGSVGDALGDTYSGIENLRGSQFDDLLVGDKNANGLIGGDGNDTIYGGGADDVLDGGAGADVITGGAGDDILTGGIGDDILQGDGGADTLTGGGGSDTASYASAASAVEVTLWQGTGALGDALGDTYSGIENLRGSRFDDQLGGNRGDNRLDGGDGNDVILGASGNDLLDGGAGADTLSGNSGNDTFVFAAGAAADSITDFDAVGNDMIDATGQGFDTLADFQALAGSSGDLNVVDAGDAAPGITVSSTGGGADLLLDFGGGDQLTLLGVSELQEDDFVLGG